MNYRRQVSLGNVCKFLNGGTPSKGVARYFQGEIPWITSADITSPVVTNARSYITEEAVKSSATNLVPAGTVLLVTRTSVGKVATTGVDLCFSQDITALEPDKSSLNTFYLVQFLRSQETYFDSQARGATIKGITRQVVANLSIPLPPLPEQQRIAAILDKAEELRAKRRAALAKLDSLSQAIFEETLADCRENLKETSLVEVAEDSRGSFVNGPFGSDLLTSELQDHGVPVVYIRDIRSGEYQRVSTVCVSERKSQKLAVCCVQPGDVLIAKVGDPPGVAAIYPSTAPNAIVTQDVIRIRSAKNVALSEWIVAYLNSSVGRWKISGITIEATRARFSLGDFKKLRIELPPLDLQKKFARRIAAVEKLKTAHRAALAELDALFASLQHRAFRGEL